MIEFVKAFKTSDGETHSTMDDAKRHELKSLFSNDKSDEAAVGSIADEILANSDRIVDILTMTASSKPKARKVNGGTKTRKPKAAAPVADAP